LSPSGTGFSNPPASAGPSILYYLIDAVNDARNVPEELKQERPKHLDAEPFLDENRQKGQDEAQQNQKDLDHALLPPLEAPRCIRVMMFR
jgi:hypothetical protein